MVDEYPFARAPSGSIGELYFAVYFPVLAAIFDGKEHKRKNFCGGYLLLSGIIFAMLGIPHEWSVLLLGGWTATCGIAIFLLGSSWWAPEYEQPSRRWRIVGR